MKLPISTLSLRKQQAIAALIANGDTEAARLCDVSVQVLDRWKQDPVFSAALRAARRADFRHQKACLRQGVKGAVLALVKIAANENAKAANRFQAAKQIVAIAEYAGEMGDFLAELTEVVGAIGSTKAKVVVMPGGEVVKSHRRGHGAKFPHKKQQAIIQLFKQRSIAQAAKETGVATQTLYHWMEEPEFDAEFRAFERNVFVEAMTLAQQKTGAAITLIRNLSLSPDCPHATQIKAGAFIVSDAQANAAEDIRACLSEEEGARGSAVTDEPAEPSKAIGRDLRERLRRLKTLLPAVRYDETEYVHAVDGRPAGSSLIGPEGWHTWSKPPEGSKVGERVPDTVAA